MQDIIPPHRVPRGSIKVPARALPPRSFASRTTPVRRMTVIEDVQARKDGLVSESITVTSAYDPAPRTRGLEPLSSGAKAEVLQRALMKAQRELRKERRKAKDLRRYALVFTASIFVLATGYVSLDTWMTNNQVKAGVTQSASGGSTWSTADEGKDEKEPTADLLANYHVAPSLPRALYIDKIGVEARVLPMGVNDKGAIQAPVNIFDAGWYNGSVKPGEIGAMFIDGHASGPTREGLFAYLDRLTVGDTLQVEKGDGSRLTYRVIHTEVVKLADIDMKKMLLPHGNTLRGLNLMTCTGKWLEDQQTYDQRVLVWTEQV